MQKLWSYICSPYCSDLKRSNKDIPTRKRIFNPKKFFLILSVKKKDFLNKDISAQKKFSVKEKLFILTREKTIFETKNKFLIITRKNNFSKQKTSYTCAKKLKLFISDVF